MFYEWTGMAGYGVTHWLFFVLMIALVLYPIGRILGRLGLSPFWSVLVLIPFVNLVALWVFALIDWPRRDERSF